MAMKTKKKTKPKQAAKTGKATKPAQPDKKSTKTIKEKPKGEPVADDPPKHLLSLCRCGECSELRFNTPSGSVCPNGHGRIHDRVPRIAMAIDAAVKTFGATVATYDAIAKRWLVFGSDDFYCVVQRMRKKIDSLPDGFQAMDKIALGPKHIFWLRPKAPVEKKVRKAK